MFKTNFSGHKKIGGGKKNLGALTPNAPSRLRAWPNICTHFYYMPRTLTLTS